jgi:hypothetical protein
MPGITPSGCPSYDHHSSCQKTDGNETPLVIILAGILKREGLAGKHYPGVLEIQAPFPQGFFVFDGIAGNFNIIYCSYNKYLLQAAPPVLGEHGPSGLTIAAW